MRSFSLSTLSLSVLLSMAAGTAFAQTGVGIGILTPDASAALDISSTSKGVLFPRVSLAGGTDNRTVLNPATSLVLYNTAATIGGMPQLVTNAGTPSAPNWVPLASAWSLTGNAGTTADNNFLGTTDNQPLVVKTNNTETARFQPTGALWLAAPNNNLLLGNGTGVKVTGSNDFFLGNNAGANTTTGYGNIFIGNNAGYNNVSGYQNLIIGAYSSSKQTSISNCTIIGLGASGGPGNNNHIVGFLAGASARGNNNMFEGYSAGSSASGNNNTCLGYLAGAQVSGNNNLSVGYNSGASLGAGVGNLLLGYEADQLPNNNGPLYNYSYATAIGYEAKVGADYAMVLGGTGAYAIKVGIGVTAPTEVLQVQGNILASGTITQNSDRRLKTNVRTLTGALGSIEKMRGVRYEFLAGKGPEGEQVGVIAQEVEKVYPELVRTDAVTGIKSVNYAQLTPVLLEALKELHNELAVTNARTLTLEQAQASNNSGIEQLRAHLRRMEAQLPASALNH